MTREDIAETLGEHWNHGPIAAKEEFERQMAGRQYGYDALRDAWGWFVCGWRGAGGIEDFETTESSDRD